MPAEPKLHLNNFTGPLELLLNLIKKNKMSLYDIQISVITQQYLAALKKLSKLNLDSFGNFLVMATKLMLIKSKMLLPDEPQTDEEDEDPRTDLVHQLVVYQHYQKAAKKLHHFAAERHEMHTRPAVIPSHTNRFLNLQNQLSVNVLQTVFQGIIKKKMEEHARTVTIQSWHYSVKQQSQLILQQLKVTPQYPFMKLFQEALPLEELITNFLAVLALIKEQRVKLIKELDRVILKAC